MFRSPAHFQEIIVDAPVVVELRVERRNQLVSLACGNDFSVDRGKRNRLPASSDNVGSADEGHRDILHAAELAGSIKTAELSAVSVPFYCDIHRAEAGFAALDLAGEKDKSGACPVDRKSLNCFKEKVSGIMERIGSAVLR